MVSTRPDESSDGCGASQLGTLAVWRGILDARMEITSIRSFFVACAVLSTAPLAAHAQLVRGQVVDSLVGTPVGRGFVVLLDGTGAEVARTLSGADGKFSLLAPRVGRYTLRSEVIAYRASVSHAFDLSIRTPTEITLRILRVPVRLSSFKVVGDEQCRPPAESMDVAPVWEEARKALSAAAWTANRTEFKHLLHRYQRVESRHERLRRENIWVIEGKATQPFASIRPDRLATSGYIVRRGDRNRYYGPDANVLLHEGFQATHCFWAERGKDEFDGLLGLKFRPVRERNVTDIEGTLWLEPETAELRQIEYSYTDLPYDFEDDQVGGSIHFARLRSGAWILSRWEIRTPVVENQRRMVSAGVIGTRQGLVGLQKIGGAVIEAVGSDGTVEFVSPDMVEITGLAYDSSRSAPLANHRVTVVGTGYSTTTDAAGRFAFKTLLSGKYQVTLARLDSLGFDYGRAKAEFVAGSPVEMVVMVPPLATVYRYLCGSGGLAGAQHIITGTITETESGIPIDKVRVEMEWNAVAGSRDGRLRARTDDDGRYVLCPVRGLYPVTVVTNAKNYDGPTYVVTFNDGVAVVDDGSGPRSVPVPERILRLDFNLVSGGR